MYAYKVEKLFSIILFLCKFSSVIRLAQVQSELIPQGFKNILHKLFLLPNLLAVVTTASQLLILCWVIILELSLRGKNLNFEYRNVTDLISSSSHIKLLLKLRFLGSTNL